MGPKRKILGEDLDPYDSICNPIVICKAENHTRKTKNCKHPWCCYGLGEVSNGIWNNDTSKCELISQLGKNYLKYVRRKDVKKNLRLMPPVGLSNLGATCYLNVLIQCLHNNLLIRDAVLSVNDSSNNLSNSSSSNSSTHMNRVVRALQNAFAHMSKSKESVYNLQDFIDLLSLNMSEQQDPQEFNKLFFDKMKTLMSSVTDCTLGKFQYSTKCCSCGYTSKRDEDFHELNVPIEQYKSADHAIAAMLSDEELEGDNRYDCPRCKMKRNAVRRCEIIKSPSVLMLQLLRYTYDMKTFGKRKIKANIQFPEFLIINGETYIFVSVLYHIGDSAYGGHYVSEVLDWEHSDWWLCDDEIVVESKSPALIKESKEKNNDDGVIDLASPQKTETSPLLSSSSKPHDNEICDLCDDEEELDNDAPDLGSSISQGIALKSSSTHATTNKSECEGYLKKNKKSASKKRSNNDAEKTRKGSNSNRQIASKLNRGKDAYMLSYVRQQDFHTAKLSHRVKVPTEVEKSLEVSNQAFVSDVVRYEGLKNSIMSQIDERKEKYRKVRAELSPSSPSDNFHLVPARWLSQWISGEILNDIQLNQKKKNDVAEVLDISSITSESKIVSLVSGATTSSSSVVEQNNKVKREIFAEKMNNAAYSCPHGNGLHPNYVKDFKVLSTSAFEVIAKDFCDFDFNQNTYRCMDCTEGVKAAQQNVNAKKQKNEKLVEIIEASLIDQMHICEDAKEKLYYIPRTWVASLKKLVKKLERDSSKLGDLEGGTLKEYFNSTDFNIDPMVTSALKCDHGSLRVDSRRSRLIIKSEAWTFIKETFPQAHELMYPEEECAICRIVQAEEKQEKTIAKEIRNQECQPQEMKDLLKQRKAAKCCNTIPREFSSANRFDGNVDTIQGSTYYLICSEWLNLWKEYTQYNGDRPSTLSNETLQCEHRLCVASNLILNSINNPNVSQERADDGLPNASIITQEQWNHLADFGYVTKDTFTIMLTKQGAEWKWNVEGCESCRGVLLSNAAQTRIEFQNESFKIYHIMPNTDESLDIETRNTSLSHVDCRGRKRKNDNASVASTEVASQMPHPSGVRRSSRSNRGSSKTYEVNLSSDDTIENLKLKIYEITDYAPHSLTVYLKGETLNQLRKTLREYNFGVGDKLEFSTVSTDVNFMDVWGDYGARSETGFTGTFLSVGNSYSDKIVIDEVSPQCQQLISMGFERSAAERCLERAGGNVEAATQFLVTIDDY